MTCWFFNNALVQNRTPFGHISQQDLHKYCLNKILILSTFVYWTNILNWPLNLALLHGKKKRYLAKALAEPIDLMALMSAANASMQKSGSNDSALIQWHTGIVRLTTL